MKGFVQDIEVSLSEITSFARCFTLLSTASSSSWR